MSSTFFFFPFFFSDDGACLPLSSLITRCYFRDTFSFLPLFSVCARVVFLLLLWKDKSLQAMMITMMYIFLLILSFQLNYFKHQLLSLKRNEKLMREKFKIIESIVIQSCNLPHPDCRYCFFFCYTSGIMSDVIKNTMSLYCMLF